MNRREREQEELLREERRDAVFRGLIAQSGGSGGGNGVLAEVDFGASFTDKASVQVTGQSWVTANSKIVAQVLTPSGVDPDEMSLLDIRPVISGINPGVGFTVTAYSRPEAKGAYQVMCMGV